MAKDKPIDAYIAKAAPFARPILEHIREVVHKACPEAEEKIKWGMPFFDYHGAILCNMAAFKEHAAFGFAKAKLLKDPHGVFDTESAMGSTGRLVTVKDLPSDKIIIDFVKQSMKLIDSGVKVERAKKPIDTDAPDYLLKALAKNKASKKTFEAFSPSNKRDYIVWLKEAKTAATREKRLEQAIEWMAEGKPRMWKYMK